MRRGILLSCSLCLVLLGCKDLGEGVKQPDQTVVLMNKQWTLYAFQLDGMPMAIPQGQVYWLVFQTETAFTARSHCNSCSGTYRVGNERSLTFHPVICTKMACPMPTLDGLFQTAMQRVSSYRYEEPWTLVLMGDNGRTVLSFFYNIR